MNYTFIGSAYRKTSLSLQYEEDQEHILEEVIGYTEKLRPDAVVIAGDIYDKSVPSAEAVAVFDDFLTRLHR